MGLRKGTSIINLKAFVDERIGPEAWDKLIATLPEADRRVLRWLVPGDWYEHTLHARLNRAFCSVFYNGDLSAAEELGRYCAERDRALANQWHFRVMPLHVAIQHFNEFWRRNDGTGTWTIAQENDEFIAHLSAWDGSDEVLCRRLLGYLGRVLAFVGEVEQARHPQCAARGDPACVFCFRWRAMPRAPVREPAASESELTDIVNELELFRDLTPLADAITALFLHRFSFTYFELWVKHEDIHEPTLFHSAGSSRRLPRRRILLQRAGQIVGRIEGEAPPGLMDKLLDDLIPHFANALDAVRLCEQQLTREQRIDRRIEVARTKYRVTRREADVLVLVADGYTNEAISEKLGLKRRSVETYVSRLQSRLRTTGCRDLCSFFWSKL